MGPPNPSMKPPPQGTLHCQMYVPGVLGDLKLKVIVSFGPEVQGEVPHGVAVSPGDAIGTFRLRPGIEKVCPTLQPDQELITLTGLPLTLSVPPMVPPTPAQKLVRSRLQPA